MKMFGVEYLYRPITKRCSGIPQHYYRNVGKALACIQADVRVPYQLKSRAE